MNTVAAALGIATCRDRIVTCACAVPLVSVGVGAAGLAVKTADLLALPEAAILLFEAGNDLVGCAWRERPILLAQSSEIRINTYDRRSRGTGWVDVVDPRPADMTPSTNTVVARGTGRSSRRCLHLDMGGGTSYRIKAGETSSIGSCARLDSI